MVNRLSFLAEIKDEASQRAASIRSNLDKIGASAGNSVLQGVGLGAGVTAFNLLGDAVGKATDFVKDSVKAAMDEEAGIARLTASLNANVEGWQAHKGAIDMAIASNIKLGFADDQTRDSLSLLAAATHDVDKALAVQQTAMDLARFKGISLAEASEALTKVEAGRFRILASLGIQLKANATAEDALAAVQKVAGGQAAAFADTTAGKMARAEASIHDLQEEIGQKLVPVLGDMANALSDGIAGIEVFAGAANDALAPVGGLEGFVQAVTDAFVPGAAATRHFTDELEQQKRTILDAGGGNREYILSLDAASDSTKTATSVTQDLTSTSGYFRDKIIAAGDSVRGLKGRLDDAAGAARDAHAALDNLATDVLDAEYGPAITAGRLAELKKQLHDAVVEQDKYKKGTDAWVIAHGRVAGLEKQIGELAQAQAKAAGDKTYAAWLQDQIKKLGASSAAGREYARQLSIVQARLRSTETFAGTATFSTRVTYARAEGGPVDPSQAYVVGEKHAELFVPKVPGYILPDVPAAGARGIANAREHGGKAYAYGLEQAGAPVSINLVVDGAVLARIVDARLHYAASVLGTGMRT
jgi:hypothetical protein